MTSKNVVDMNGAKASARALAIFNDLGDNDDLSSGVTGGFSVISIRGSKWRVKSGGDEVLITDADGEMLPSLRVLMLKANKDISKNYYEGGYQEGSSDAPDCFSMDGKKPDPSVENPVAPACASCPKNVFGSKISENGSKGKACADMRRVVILPEGDFKNERFGGPMLLRVPAASLSELAAFGKAMSAKGFPYNTIITRISFDPETAYPRLKFNAVRPITEDEAGEVAALLQDESFKQKVEYILNKPVDVTAPEGAAEEAPVQRDPTEFEEAAPPPRAAAPKAAKPKPTVVAPPPPPVEEEEEIVAAGGADDEGLGDLDDILSKLDELS